MSSASDAAGDESEYTVSVVVGSLILGVFFGGVGGGVAFPTLPTLGTVLEITPFLVGIILSANRFTRLVVNTPVGQLIDRFGTRTPMITGFLLQSLGPFGYVLGLYADWVPVLGSAAIFIIARVLWGFGSAFVFVGSFSTITHITKEENRGRWTGYFRGGQTIGFPSGLILGGVLADLYGYTTAFATAGMAGLLATAVAVAFLPNINMETAQPVQLTELLRVVRGDCRILGSVEILLIR